MPASPLRVKIAGPEGRDKLVRGTSLSKRDNPVASALLRGRCHRRNAR